MSSTAIDTHGHGDHGEQHSHGFVAWCLRWITTTNHKDIGTLYLTFSLLMLFVGGGMAMVIRAELFQPGMQLVRPEFFNSMTTLHALVMVFAMIMPAFAGFANWMIPLMIGAPDMALPRLNNWSFWLLPFAVGLLILTLFLPGGAPAGGWTLYPPLVLQTGDAFPFAIFAVHLLGVSSILAAINIIVTIMNLRAPGMALLKMPMFVWTWLITAYLLVLAMPVLAGGVTMLLTDRFFGTSFFSAAGGGDPVLFQHIFWFFGHPEVYIIILPAFGIVSEVIPTFARKPLFGYAAMVYATASIAFLSLVVWAHHMFTAGMPLAGQLFFMLSTMIIAVPTGVKIFNWTATLWRGSLTFETPMLYALAFLFLFTLGGFSGLMLAIVPADIQYHDTLLRRRALPLRARARRAVRRVRGRLLLAAEVDGPHVRRDARQGALLAHRDLHERDVLPAAFLGVGGDAAPYPRLRAAVRGLQRDLEPGRVRARCVAALVRVRDHEVHPRRSESDGAGLGQSVRPRMDGAVAGAAPHVRRATRNQMSDRGRQAIGAAPGGERDNDVRVAKARRNAWLLGGCAVLFYLGYMAWMMWR